MAGTQLDPHAAHLARQQLHILFAVDASGSMVGERIASLNYALRSAIPAMRSAALDNPEVDVLVRALRFSDDVSWVTGAPVPVDKFEWSDLDAHGETNMGAAFRALTTALSPDAMPGRQLVPVIVLLSDGLATDDADTALGDLLASPLAGKAIRVAIAIGKDADKPLLHAFIGNAAMKPLEANNAAALVSRIAWAATAPMKAASQPVGTSADPVEALAAEAEGQNKDGGDLVW